MVQRGDGYRRSPVWRVLGGFEKNRVPSRRSIIAVKALLASWRFIRSFLTGCGLEVHTQTAYILRKVAHAGNGHWKKIKMTERSQFFAGNSQKMAKHPSKRSQYEPNSQPFPAIWG